MGDDQLVAYRDGDQSGHRDQQAVHRPASGQDWIGGGLDIAVHEAARGNEVQPHSATIVTNAQVPATADSRILEASARRTLPVTLPRTLGRLWLVELVQGCRPAGQELEAVLGSRAGLGPVHHQRQPRVGRQGQHLIGQLEVPDHRVVHPLAAGLVPAHVVGRPPATELLAAGRQLPDQVLQPPVMGLRPASVRRLATRSLAVLSQSGKNAWARGLRNTRRATLAGRTGSTKISE